MGKLMILVVLFTIIGFFLIIVYNSLIKLKQRSIDAWAGLEAQLRRRYDIIPDIVAVMEEYAKSDRPLLHAATEARSMASSVYNIREKAGAESFLGSALNSLFTIVDKYPQLKSDERFRDLRIKLGQIEDAIQSARRVYNAQVQDYNSRLKTIPNSIVAKMFNLKDMKTF